MALEDKNLKNYVSTTKIEADSNKSPTEDIQRPSVDKDVFTVEGLIASSTHGSRHVPVATIEVPAGTTLHNLKFEELLRSEDIIHISADVIKATYSAYYIPNVRVWDEAEAFTAQAQRENPIEQAPITVPSYVNPGITSDSIGSSIEFGDGSRRHWFITTYRRENIAANIMPTFPFLDKWNVLPVRAAIAVYNDYLRVKGLQSKFVEYNSSVVSDEEAQNYFNLGLPWNGSALSFGIRNVYDIPRAAAPQHYLNSWRYNVLADNDPVDLTSLFSHVTTQQMVAEYREQSGNADKTDWEIVSKMRGVKQALENKVTFLNQDTIDIDIDLQLNTSQSELPLGSDGATSYTKVNSNISCFGFNAKYDGYVIIFRNVFAPNAVKTTHSTPIEFLKFGWQDFIRENMQLIKDRSMTRAELDSLTENTDTVVGWLRKYNEYTSRLPDYINNDFLDYGIIQTGQPITGRGNLSGLLTQDSTGSVIDLNSHIDWTFIRSSTEDLTFNQYPVEYNKLDFTDLVLPRLLVYYPSEGTPFEKRLKSQQTFWFYGKYELKQTLPLTRSVENNYQGKGSE